ncbi:MAG: Transposase [uncultured Chloroflexia bacterium]|uniref:Transposase n=1 Tax=uncultured Chloroflexia bacterium TaxID=1672391 RepID=A0A6J4MUQ5_9CHLR|nr:MAG: Transposase [uncultured Chloroflexia bacterium]
MRRPKVFPHFTKRICRSEFTTCLTCGTRLRRYATLSQRPIITLSGPIRLTHCGYRCPDPACSTARRSYRSATADALALPGFTFGLDIVVLVGHLRLAHHHTLDQTHQVLQARLAPFEQTISRREISYLFDAYTTLVRATHEVADDKAWHEQVRANGGLIISIDGIQPDKGNETVYLVRDVLSGRILAAENLRVSDTETITRLLAPVVALDLPVLGAISDAQESLCQAIADLWPNVPHQLCQFHYLREASRPSYDLDRGLRKQIRKAIQQSVRATRDQLERQATARVETDPAEAEQLAVLSDYALSIQTALNLDGQQPFKYASLAVDDALTDIAASLEELEKKGAHEVGAVNSSLLD